MTEDQSRTRVTREAHRNFYPNGRRGRFVVLPEFDLIYVKNAKVAASTLTLWLHRIYTGDYSLDTVRNIHAIHAMPRPQEIGWARVARMLDGEAFRFSFVRDPIRRMESAYLDKIAQTESERCRAEIRQLLGLPADAPVSLDHFVDALEAQDPLDMDPHWRPQHLNLMHPLVELDFIGKLESFSADLARLCEATGLPEAPVQVLNPSERSSTGVFDGRRDLLRRVREVYARDFELYGY